MKVPIQVCAHAPAQYRRAVCLVVMAAASLNLSPAGAESVAPKTASRSALFDSVASRLVARTCVAQPVALIPFEATDGRRYRLFENAVGTLSDQFEAAFGQYMELGAGSTAAATTAAPTSIVPDIWRLAFEGSSLPVSTEASDLVQSLTRVGMQVSELPTEPIAQHASAIEDRIRAIEMLIEKAAQNAESLRADSSGAAKTVLIGHEIVMANASSFLENVSGRDRVWMLARDAANAGLSSSQSVMHVEIELRPDASSVSAGLRVDYSLAAGNAAVHGRIVSTCSPASDKDEPTCDVFDDAPRVLPECPTK